MLVVGAFLLDDRTLLYMHVAETTHNYIYIYIYMVVYEIFTICSSWDHIC